MRLRVKTLKIQVFRWAAILGLFFSFVVNILWCLFVLRIVPQTATDENYPSLQQSKQKGEISTVPIIEIIKLSYKQFTWLGYFVQVFISLSITVSFITMSLGMKHMADGWCKTFEAAQKRADSYATRVTTWIKSKIKYLNNHPERISTLFKGIMYTLLFFPVYLLAQINPHR